MPSKAKRPCGEIGCRNLTTEGYCDEHKKETHHHDKQRGSSNKRGYGYRWQKARQGYLRKHPLCVKCEEQGRVEAATEVDHIIPHRGNMKLFWDKSNWQGLCKSHHSSKTAKGE